MADYEPRITYTVQELLARIESKVDQMFGQLSNKADRTDIAELYSHLNEVKGRVSNLEFNQEHSNRDKDRRRWFWPILVASLLTVGGILATVLSPLIVK